MERSQLPTLSYGFIDSASIIGAVGALTSYRTPQEWGEWTRQSIANMTLALIVHDGLKIAPGPSKPTEIGSGIAVSKLYQCYDQACRLLADIVKDMPLHNVPTATVQESAQKAFIDWLRNYPEEARNAIIATKQEIGCSEWEQWSIENAWVDHARRLNGLFNAEMIEELAIVFGVKSNDLRFLWKKTTDLKQVQTWSQGKNLDSDFKLARDAYLAAAILRGRYHDDVATKMNLDILHHPIRQHVLIPIAEGTIYRIPEAIETLSQIIVKSAMDEKRPEDRVVCLAENLRTVRLSFHQGSLEHLCNPEIEGDKAIDLAIDTVKSLHLRVHSRSIEKFLELGTIGSTITITTLVGTMILFPWGTIAGASISVGASVLGLKKSLGKREAQALKLTRGHLRKLATSKPGRIVPWWRRD